ncbi:MAG: DUF393 domain-containing protein [Pseudomonadales bacterium]|nr:DUF393 domain-containing protein [Pseudomonadales bacterium]
MKSSLTLYFDGDCPLCLMEIEALKKLSEDGRLSFVDVNSVDFAADHPHIDKAAALAKLHGMTNDGRMLYGLDVTVAAWSAVGKHRWLRILRWPILRYIADAVYWLFARYRAPIAWMLTGRKHGSCAAENCSPGDDSSFGSSS